MVGIAGCRGYCICLGVWRQGGARILSGCSSLHSKVQHRRLTERGLKVGRPEKLDL